MTTYTVVYHDPKRKTGAAHSLHVAGCGDVEWALRRDRSGLCSAADIEAGSLPEALHVAEADDLGDVEPAPCTAG